jgi:hypothetical protein
LNRQLVTVAIAFRAVGILLGIPSLFACLWLTALKLDLAAIKPDKSGQSDWDAINIGRDGILGVIAAIFTPIFKGFELFGNLLGWFAGVLDIVAAALTLAAVCLFFTGRGLAQHSEWARIAAVFAASGFLLISFLTMTALRRGAARPSP